ncbi:flavin-binding monooxygenase-like protein [Lasiosphaeria miniovina]|uniref:Flavin-binding monooxygenase-like protein n=1 Tax=Lasiosphaeria miniovina TaxID=1954250 RepID=A0AA40ACI2_9PEZI|nr:flavin-binding monooxygenase-like protein [Lasiosphaeria miniovina]KAK0713340.1 flavin-binding monooxygenase-like protein [Lasiosphaeria miniovina]
MGDHIPATASSQRVEPGSVNLEPFPWPVTAQNQSVDAGAVAATVVGSVNDAVVARNFAALASLFLADGFWRDHVAVSWDLHTAKGPAAIEAFLAAECHLARVEIDASSDFRKPQLTGFAPAGDVKGIGFFINVATRHGAGRGMVRLVEKEGEWKIWTFFTTLEELAGFEEPRGPRRPKGVEHGSKPGRLNWLERGEIASEFVDSEPAVLIIGAGQGGLTAHARLKMLNVSALIVDSNSAVGDNWRKRYDQLVLHDPVWYDHLPYVPFPDTWPVFTPKDKLADWFASYAQTLELNVWMQTEIESSAWDDDKKEWTVTVRRGWGDKSETRTLHPKHVIQATGASGEINLPDIPGMDGFEGDVLCHSSDFPGAEDHGPNEARTRSSTKKAIVVGACNSSHDICQDYYEHGYDVTMVQRSSTCVVTSEAALKFLVGPLYSEGNGLPIEDSDVAVWSWPSEVMKSLQVDLTKLQVEHDATMLAGLEAAGFKVDTGPNGGGLFTKYLQRGGGYYIDVGTSQLIIDGKIRVKQGQDVVEVLPRGLRFADGSELEADEIVFATGYANMRTRARSILGDALADRIGDVWGWDAEGEMRGIWRRSGHPGFWFHGGNLAMCRYWSRVLALQIKASLEGLS